MNSPNDGRRRRSGATIGSWVVSVAFGLAAAASAAEPRIYRGCCDASAAAALNDQVLAVASDEENVLRLYRRDADGPPIATWAAPVSIMSSMFMRQASWLPVAGSTRCVALLV